MTTTFQTFDPFQINWQGVAIKDIWKNFDYKKGVHEVLLSGSVGSAKSLFMTHTICRHVVQFEQSRALIGRLSRPDLKATLVSDINDHIEGDFIEGKDYEFNMSDLTWKWWNGSEIISKTWHDKRFKKLRSLKLSAAGIEELTENTGEHWDAYDAIYSRVGRLPHVPMNLMICATNPDSTGHPAYKKLIQGSETDPLKHVYYSLTTDNKFLPDWYIKNLMENMTPIDIERLINGRWVDDPKGGIYWNYDSGINFRDEPYIFNLDYPIDIMHDFNIGKNKPMSAAVGQRIDGVFHIAKAYIVHTANTQEIMEEMESDGVFERKTYFRDYGDASGKNNDTRSKTTDYEIIENFLKRYRRADGSSLTYKMRYRKSNPPIRKRHNRVNAQFKNYEGRVKLYIYKDASKADDGFRNTKLKKGGEYLEDDSFENQHVTTAIGYYIVDVTESEETGRSKQYQL